MKTTNMRVILVAFFLSFSTTAICQNAKIDSLQTKLLKHKALDSKRVSLLNDLAFLCYKGNTVKADTLLKESISISKSIDYKQGEARGLYLKGKIEYKQSEYKKAIKFFKEAVLLYETLDDQKGVAQCYESMGFSSHYDGEFNSSIQYFLNSIAIYEGIDEENKTPILLKFIGYNNEDLGNFDVAFEYYTKALNANTIFKDSLEISSCYMNMGSVFLRKANYPLALEYYNKSLKISEKLHDTIGISKLLNNIGNIYKNNKDYNKAILNYTKSLQVQKKIGNKRNISKALSNLGSIYLFQNDFKKALNHYSEAIAISKEINDRDSQSTNLVHIGRVYMRFNEHSKSIVYFEKAKKINIEINDQLGLCYSYLGLGESYWLQKNYDQGLINAAECNNLANKLGAISFQRDSYHLLSKLYEAKGDYKSSFENYKQFKRLNDSLFNKKNTERIAKLEAEYKYKRALDSASIRELKLTQAVTATSQSLEKSRRNYLWAIIGVLLISILSGSVIFYQKLRNAQAKTQNAVIEQKLLRSQMTPHFMFNSLSVLQGMILNKEGKKSVSYLSKFSKLLRITLENSRDKMVSLSDELKAVENYLALQNLENNDYQYSVNVEDSLDVPSLRVPPMLIQPFVENAIEHAFVNGQENKKIEILLVYSDKTLACTIVDNGVGYDYGKDKGHKDKNSLSTIITSERLAVLSKDLKMTGSVLIEDRKKYNDNGTTVNLIIPHIILAS